MSREQSKPKSKVKRIIAVVVVVAVLGTSIVAVSSRMSAAREEAIFNIVTLEISPKSLPEYQVTLDMRRSQEELIDELAVALGPVLPSTPINYDTGTVAIRHGRDVVVKPTILGYINNINPYNKNKVKRMKVYLHGSFRKYRIRYVTESSEPYRLSFDDKDHVQDCCVNTRYHLFQKEVMEEILSWCQWATDDLRKRVKTRYKSHKFELIQER